MPKYLIQGSYTQEGLQGLLKDGGSQRRSVVDRLVRGMGGTLEAFYFAFGGADVYVIADLPDDASAVAASLTASASGGVGLRTTVLITPETMDDATKKSVDYTPPGQ